MNKIIAVPAQQIVNLENTSYTSSKSQREAQRLRDLFILLTDLIAREKATIELIIDCLYDIGYVNWLDRKVPVRSVNWLAKLVAKTSKPVIRLVAWRWFNRNCPQLITKWLYSKVKF
jgi:hypothetical protein